MLLNSFCGSASREEENLTWKRKQTSNTRGSCGENLWKEKCRNVQYFQVPHLGHAVDVQLLQAAVLTGPEMIGQPTCAVKHFASTEGRSLEESVHSLSHGKVT